MGSLREAYHTHFGDCSGMLRDAPGPSLMKESLGALSGAGLLTTLTPKSLGGLEVDPVTYASVIEETTRFNGCCVDADQSLVVGVLLPSN